MIDNMTMSRSTALLQLLIRGSCQDVCRFAKIHRRQFAAVWRNNSECGSMAHGAIRSMPHMPDRLASYAPGGKGGHL